MAAVAVLAAGSATVGSLAQSSADIWWTGYGNGPDNSRYFASRQIDKSNVTELQVAWTYPFGDTGSSPIVVRGVAYGRGRNGSLVAVDAQTGKELWVRENMNGMTSRGFNYWESRRRRRPADHLLDEQPAAGGGREDGQVHHVVRHQRRRRSARSASTAAIRRPSATSSRTRPARSSRTC